MHIIYNIDIYIYSGVPNSSFIFGKFSNAPPLFLLRPLNHQSLDNHLTGGM